MKKLVCIVLILCLMPLVAIADDINTFTAAWNAYAPQYGAPPLNPDSQDDGFIVGDGWKLGLTIDDDGYDSIIIIGKDADTLLPMATIAGLIFEGNLTPDEITSYIGKLAQIYFQEKSTGKSNTLITGSHLCFFSQKDDTYSFIMVEI